MGDKMISILIPVYNVEQYLERCLDCVINQTYKSIEILVVWQPSEDKSLDILKEYQKKDNRIRIIEQITPDLALARNTLIKEAKSDLVCFVDSDDMISENFVENLYSKMCDTNADITITKIFAFKNVNQINKEKLEESKNVNIYDNIDFMKSVFTGKIGNFTGVMQAKLYKKSLFHNVEFPTKRLSEDNATIYKIYWQAKKIAVLDTTLYYYQSERDDSIMHGKKYNKRLIEASLINRQEQFNFFLDKNDILSGVSAYNILTERMRLIGSESLNVIDNAITKDLENNKYFYLKKVLLSKNDFKIKTLSILCVICPKTMYKIWLKRKSIKYKNEWRKK